MCLDRPPTHPTGWWIISKLLDFGGSWNLVCKLSYTQLKVPDNLSFPNWHERSTLSQLAWAFDAYLFSKFKGQKVISSVALLQPSLFETLIVSQALHLKHDWIWKANKRKVFHASHNTSQNWMHVSLDGDLPNLYLKKLLHTICIILLNTYHMFTT